MINPKAVQSGNMGLIINTFEKKGFKLVAMKMVSPGEDHFRKHYADLSKKPFFEELIKFSTSGPCVAMVWEGENVVLTSLKMI